MISGEYYSPGGLSDEALDRYTNFFGNMTILARVIEESQTPNKYSKITNNKVKIVNSLDLSRKQVKNLIDDHDVVIIRLPSFNGFKFASYVKKSKKPYLVEVVGCAWDSLYNHSNKGKIIALPLYFYMKRVVRQSKVSVYVTNEFLQKRYPTRGHKYNISNVNIKEIRFSAMEDRIARVKDLTNFKTIKIGTIGAYDVLYKGQEYMIKSLPILNQKTTFNFVYELVGQGNKERLFELAKSLNVEKQIKFIGVLPKNKVFEWLENIDIYIQPSLQEGLPRALIEAMSVGLPAIGSRTAGIPELINDEMIIKRGKRGVNDIIELLSKVDKLDLNSIAISNFEESKNYVESILNERREKAFNYLIEN
jgi:glycosyltransferase involved in cell wall biosynthesis